jgi:hypothetical protein
MMVEALVHHGEQEDGSMYNTIDTVLGENDNNNASPIEEQPIDTRGFKFKFELVHKRWEALYDLDGAVRLKEAMKKHLYRKKFGEEALRPII